MSTVTVAIAFWLPYRLDCPSCKDANPKKPRSRVMDQYLYSG
ncbi:hypothetical protein [Chlorogloeopsis fritschii]|nr:hypothetical protein [Chlorogloeopsis fritschii]